jgi:hypothetical protein
MSKKRLSQEYSFHDVFSTKENCGQTETLYEYFQELLSKEDQERFEQHLAGCSICAQTLSELSESERVTDRTVLDAEKADKIFRQNRVQIEEMLNKKYGTGSPVAPVAWKFRLPVYANATLVLLVGLLIYPSYRSFVLEREVTRLQHEIANLPKQTQAPQVNPVEPVVSQPPEPVVSPSLVFAIRAERDTEQKTIRIPFEDNQSFTLLFSLPSDNFDRYVLEIDRKNRNIWRKEIRAVRDEASQLISVTVHSEYFQEGEHQLRITGKQGARMIKLTGFKLMISKKKEE